MTDADKLRDILEQTDCSRGQWEPLLDSLVAERDAWKVEALHHNAEEIRLREAATKVTDAYTAEAEDHNDGEFALWQKDDLVNAIVALRAALGEDA